MIRKLVLYSILSLSCTQPCSAYISSQELRVPFTNINNDTYVDIESFREIIRRSDDEGTTIEQIVSQLNDYFSSAPIALSPQGQFTVLESKFIFKTDKIPWEFAQQAPLFAVREAITPGFALAYAKFLSKVTQELIPVVKQLVASEDGSESKQDHYSFYYLCLRTLAITQVIDQRVQGCLNESISYFKPKDPNLLIRLANVYIKLYRASRFVFESVSEQGIERYLQPKPYYKIIDVFNEKFQLACQPVTEIFATMAHAKRQISENARHRLPGGLVSSIAWGFWGSNQSTRDYNILSAMPDFKFISGPYFNVTSQQGYHSDTYPNYRHICGDFLW